jgi:hypothetical protein
LSSEKSDQAKRLERARNKLLRVYFRHSIELEADLKRYADATRDLSDFTDIKHGLYSLRAKMTRLRGSLAMKLNEYAKVKVKMKRNCTHSMTFGALLEGFEDAGVKPRDKADKEIYMASYLADVDEIIGILDVYIKMLSDNIATVDKLTYGIPYFIELDKTYKPR